MLSQKPIALSLNSGNGKGRKLPDPILDKYTAEGILGAKPGMVKGERGKELTLKEANKIAEKKAKERPPEKFNMEILAEAEEGLKTMGHNVGDPNEISSKARSFLSGVLPEKKVPDALSNSTIIKSLIAGGLTAGSIVTASILLDFPALFATLSIPAFFGSGIFAIIAVEELMQRRLNQEIKAMKKLIGAIEADNCMNLQKEISVLKNDWKFIETLHEFMAKGSRAAYYIRGEMFKQGGLVLDIDDADGRKRWMKSKPVIDT